MVAQKKWIQKATKKMEKKGTKGAFSRSAQKAGMSTKAYANKVLHDPHASALQKKRANFAKNVAK